MKLYFTFTKKSLAVVLALAIAILILLGQFFSVKASSIDGSSNAKRVEYISRLGINADETPTNVKDITVPQNFSLVYENYNLLQKKAGFNLENYKGKSVKIYTYKFSDNDENLVHLMVCRDEIIGGDIANIRIDGEMKPLGKIDEGTTIR